MGDELEELVKSFIVTFYKPRVGYRLWTLVNRGLEDEDVDLSLPCR